MLTLQPNILERNGEKAFVVLAYEEYLQIEQMLDDYADLLALRETKSVEKSSPTISLATFKNELAFKAAQTT